MSTQLLKAKSPTVTRYVATYVNRNGMRTLMSAAQGRNTYATREDAETWLRGILSNNAADRIESIWGSNPQFEIRACDCWPGHFDPVGVWFD